MAFKDYRGDGITVQYDPDICIHSGNCVKALPQVFRPTQRPWILATAASADEVEQAIGTCPSGALRFIRAEAGEPASAEHASGASEPQAPATSPVVITVSADGPNVIAGPVELRNDRGELVRTAAKLALCRCGASQTKPYCDGSHKDAGFADPGPAAKGT